MVSVNKLLKAKCKYKVDINKFYNLLIDNKYPFSSVYFEFAVNL